MNLNKARDFYSAYYEGTLDSGLSQAFERALTTEAQVKAEYEQFVRIMEQLKDFQDPIKVPDDLHLKIRERVDAHIVASEQTSKAGSGFFAWKPLAYGAVAAAAIIGAVMSLSNIGRDSGPATGGMAVISHSAPTVVFKNDVVRLQFNTTGQNSVTIADMVEDIELARVTLTNQSLNSPLINNSDEAVVVQALFASDFSPLMIGVPGKVRLAEEEGTGSFPVFVKAVTSMYSMPVVVEAENVEFNVSWQFETSDVLSSISEELETLGLRADVHEDGMLWIRTS